MWWRAVLQGLVRAPSPAILILAISLVTFFVNQGDNKKKNTRAVRPRICSRAAHFPPRAKAATSENE
jgi:hypothetical protein